MVVTDEPNRDTAPWAAALVETYDLDAAVLITFKGTKGQLQSFGRNGEDDEFATKLAQVMWQILNHIWQPERQVKENPDV
jgi:hypothetical protein